MTAETSSPARALPSGEQFEINAGGQRATIVEVGGGLREYAVDGRPVLEPYAADRMRDGAHGAPLIPWPNRLEDGRYSFDGTTYQVPLTEPEKRNAIHGFLLWQPWEATERDADRVVMKTHLHPREGYPFTLGIRISYELGPQGLTVATTAENLGDRACPYGDGHHPYLSPGSGRIDACTLQLSGSTRIVTDPSANCRPAANPSKARTSTSWSLEAWARLASTTRSPISSATTTAGRGPGSGGPTGDARSSGSMAGTASSRPIQATPSPLTARAGASGPSR